MYSIVGTILYSGTRYPVTSYMNRGRDPIDANGGVESKGRGGATRPRGWGVKRNKERERDAGWALLHVQRYLIIFIHRHYFCLWQTKLWNNWCSILLHSPIGTCYMTYSTNSIPHWLVKHYKHHINIYICPIRIHIHTTNTRSSYTKSKPSSHTL